MTELYEGSCTFFAQNLRFLQTLRLIQNDDRKALGCLLLLFFFFYSMHKGSVQYHFVSSEGMHCTV